MNIGEEDKTEKYRSLIDVWSDNLTADFKTICIKSGVSDKTFYTYRQDKTFIEMLKEAYKEKYPVRVEAIKKIDSQIDDGDFKGMRHSFKLLGIK